MGLLAEGWVFFCSDVNLVCWFNLARALLRSWLMCKFELQLRQTNVVVRRMVLVKGHKIKSLEKLSKLLII